MRPPQELFILLAGHHLDRYLGGQGRQHRSSFIVYEYW